MTIKVCVNPTWRKKDKADGGIRRNSEAQWKYLPQFGVEPVYTPTEADILASHGSARFGIADKPIVSHCHGLHWSSYTWPAWAHESNRQVVEALSEAVAHTAPSQWVASAMRRGMLVYPEVIHHGVDSEFWKPPDEWSQYILWNKARSDPVSNPNDMQRIAANTPEFQYVSTIGNETENVKTIGTMSVEEMYEWVQHAGLYLCTARETFGIGTLEAMACGVPVVGWNWGGQAEIIEQGITGFLAEPGDYKALADGIKWAVENRDFLSENARQAVVENWGWEQRIEQYANLYKRTLAWWKAPERKVSILVTAYNLGKYLSDCLSSIAEQDFEDWECVIVDDCSEDNTLEIAKEWTSSDPRFRYFKTDKNLKLAGARNYGFKQCKGKYILPLDADDMLADHALRTLSGAMDSDPTIHIAYGHLETISENGENKGRNKDWPFDAYSWYGQMAHLNQLPYSAMMRREVMERTGGYRVRNWRAEDAELWIRATSFGFRAAKVTQASTLVYRWRPDSKTAEEHKDHSDGDGDWTAWYPWRLGAETGKQGMLIFRGLTGATHPRPDLVPWGTQGFAPKEFWPVPDRSTPAISVVIPVGPKHGQYVIDALDSIVAQTYQDWEVIVVNATGEEWGIGFDSPVAGAPFARVVSAGKTLNPAQARNLGSKFVKGHAILFLDADDILLPHVMEEMLELHLGTNGGLIYTDWLRGDGSPDIPLTLYEAKEFKCGEVIRQMQHAMMCLVPRAAHEKIGGFDETLPGWEDWDYLIALQEAGVCSYRLDKAGFVYRFYAGSVREDSFGKHDQIIPMLVEKWGDYAKGKKKMPCSGCPGKRRAIIREDVPQPDVQLARNPNGMVMLEYRSKRTEKIKIRGQVSSTYYKFRRGEQKWVMVEDAEHMLGIRRRGIHDFVLVAQPKELPVATIKTFTQQEIVEAEAPPEFPKMDLAEEKISEPDDMPRLANQFKETIPHVDDATLLKWLNAERKGKKRKTVIAMIEETLNERASETDKA